MFFRSAVSISLLAHIAGMLWLAWWSERVTCSDLSFMMTESIQIKVIHSKKKPVLNREATSQNPHIGNQDNSMSSDEIGDTRPKSIVSRDGGRSTYRDLLPGPEKAFDQNFGKQTQAGNSLGTGKGSSLGIDHLVGRFNIPLFIRQHHSKGKAIAKILRKKSGEIFIEYVQGLPIIRSVLFEALRKMKNRRALIELLDQSDFEEIRFSLSFKTSKEANNGHVIKVSTAENQINITVFFSESSKENVSIGFMGGSATGEPESVMISLMIPLPDEEAKRAIRRDKSILRRLRGSPANFAPIRNYPLN